jgi:DNA-binding transcriptional ArsR family regulator
VHPFTALAEPRRRAILSLVRDEPRAASDIARAFPDVTQQAVSLHLKVLADAGLVAEAPELAKDRRERWWRADPAPISWSIADVAGDPLGEIVTSAAEQQNLAHHVGKVQQWYARRDPLDTEWVRAAASTDGWVSVTPAELAGLGRRINDLIAEYAATPERRADPGRALAFAFAHVVPAQP